MKPRNILFALLLTIGAMTFASCKSIKQMQEYDATHYDTNYRQAPIEKTVFEIELKTTNARTVMIQPK